MKVNGKDDIPYMKWKIKFMFQTTMPYAVCHPKMYCAIWPLNVHASCGKATKNDEELFEFYRLGVSIPSEGNEFETTHQIDTLW